MISKNARLAVNTINKEKRMIIKRLNYNLQPYLKYTGYGLDFRFNMFGRIKKTGDHRAYKISKASDKDLSENGIIGFYNGGVINDIFVGLATTSFEAYTLKDLEAIENMLYNTKVLSKMERNVF